MSYAFSSSILLSLVAQEYDLEAEVGRLRSELFAMQASRGALEAQVNTNPHSRLAMALRSQLLTIKQAEKFIAMRLNQVMPQIQANQQMQQSVKQVVQKGVKLFGPWGGGG